MKRVRIVGFHNENESEAPRGINVLKVIPGTFIDKSFFTILILNFVNDAVKY